VAKVWAWYDGIAVMNQNIYKCLKQEMRDDELQFGFIPDYSNADTLWWSDWFRKGVESESFKVYQCTIRSGRGTVLIEGVQ
jgi:hypothetical protein